MLPSKCHSSLLRAATAAALALALVRCTPGGQFDPTSVLDNDMFDTKAKLKGQREPLFPNGVPGATTGVPADLVKGYKAPDQGDSDPDAINAPPAAQAAASPPAQAETKPRPKPTPKVAIGHPRTPAQKPPSSSPTRIDLGAKGAPPQQPSASDWPASPPNGGAQQNTAWPAPPPTGGAPQQAPQQAQGIWPAPPPTAPVQPAAAPARTPAPAPASAPPSQNGPSFDSMWPKSTDGNSSQ